MLTTLKKNKPLWNGLITLAGEYVDQSNQLYRLKKYLYENKFEEFKKDYYTLLKLGLCQWFRFIFYKHLIILINLTDLCYYENENIINYYTFKLFYINNNKIFDGDSDEKLLPDFRKYYNLNNKDTLKQLLTNAIINNECGYLNYKTYIKDLKNEAFEIMDKHFKTDIHIKDIIKISYDNISVFNDNVYICLNNGDVYLTLLNEYALAELDITIYFYNDLKTFKTYVYEYEDRFYKFHECNKITDINETQKILKELGQFKIKYYL